MKSAFWLAYQRNHQQSCATNSADHYRYRRHWIRSLRRHSPTHYDVGWYAESLGLEPFSTAVTLRTIDWGRVSASGITGPVGKLP
jgi:hypothetical protein